MYKVSIICRHLCTDKCVIIQVFWDYSNIQSVQKPAQIEKTAFNRNHQMRFVNICKLSLSEFQFRSIWEALNGSKVLWDSFSIENSIQKRRDNNGKFWNHLHLSWVRTILLRSIGIIQMVLKFPWSEKQGQIS